MSEVLVLFLVLVQIVLICCCVFVVKSYCGLPYRLARRAFSNLLRDPDVENQRETVPEAPKTPAPACTAAQPIQSIYSPRAMYFHPYPYHQIPQVTNNLPYPALPASIPAMPSYPHEIGFVITAPSPGSSTTSLVTNLTEDHQKEPTEKK